MRECTSELQHRHGGRLRGEDGGKGNSSNVKDVECSSCGTRGHAKKDCWYKDMKRSKKKSKQGQRQG